MVFNLIKYEQTKTGLMLPDRPSEITKVWGTIKGAYFNPITLESLAIPRKESLDHRGLKLEFENNEGFDQYRILFVQENSDLGHLIQIAGLNRDSEWRNLLEKNVFLYFGKGEEYPLYGFSFDFFWKEYINKDQTKKY